MKKDIVLQSKPAERDIASFICGMIMTVVLLVAQILYKENVLSLIVFLAVLDVYIALSCLVRESYLFTDDGLKITHRLRKTITIDYDSIYNLSTEKNDRITSFSTSNSVKIYYENGNNKKAVSCRPNNRDFFLCTLKERCEVFQCDKNPKTGLDVFFK